MVEGIKGMALSASRLLAPIGAAVATLAIASEPYWVIHCARRYTRAPPCGQRDGWRLAAQALRRYGGSGSDPAAALQPEEID